MNYEVLMHKDRSQHTGYYSPNLGSDYGSQKQRLLYKTTVANRIGGQVGNNALINPTWSFSVQFTPAGTRGNIQIGIPNEVIEDGQTAIANYLVKKYSNSRYMIDSGEASKAAKGIADTVYNRLKVEIKHSDIDEDDDVIDCEDILEHKAKSNLVRLENAWYEPSHDSNSPVSNPLHEDYYIYQKPNSGLITASFNYPAGSSYSQYYAAIIKLSVFNGEIHDYDNGSKKPLTIQNLKQMILHAVTVRISGDKLVDGLVIDDATAARAAAQAWADMQDDIAKINSRKRREANASGKFEKKNDSGKNQGSWIRKQFFIRHSYDVIRTEDYLEHKIKSPKIYQQQHSGYYSPNLHEKVIYEVQDRGGELPNVVFAFVPKNGNEAFGSSMDCTSRMISDKSAIEKVILNRFNYGLGHTASEYGELDKVQLAKFVNLIQKRLIDYSKGSDYYTVENGKLQRHHADPKITADPHPQHSGYYSPNLRHSAYTVVPAGESELYHHGILGMKWGVRRYQNADGSLTDLGKKHYGLGNPKYQRKKKV